MADLLLHLESVGFEGASRHRGYDEGRELLTFLPGEDGPISWSHLHSNVGLASVAQPLRSYHNAIRHYRPSDDTTWADSVGAPGDGEIMCHGDFAPWNLLMVSPSSIATMGLRQSTRKGWADAPPSRPADAHLLPGAGPDPHVAPAKYAPLIPRTGRVPPTGPATLTPGSQSAGQEVAPAHTTAGDLIVREA